MSTFAQMAHDNRNAAIKAVQDLYASAADEGRDLSAEEQEQADRMEADIQDWAAKRDKALRAENYAVEGALARGETEERIELPASRKSVDTVTSWDLFKRGARAFDMGQSYHFDFANDGGEATVQTRALQSQGGSAVPTTYADQVIGFLRTGIPLLRPEVVNLIETDDGHPITFFQITADPNHGGSVTAEGAGINELDPTLASSTLGAYKYGITTLMSRELFDDNSIDLSNLIARSQARELKIDINAALTTNTGSGTPTGVVGTATVGATATGTASGSSTDTFFSPADLFDLWYSLADEYRSVGNLSWLVSNTAAAKMRKFRDSNKGFIWDSSVSAGQPDRFNGAIVYENAAMAAVASASKSVAVGDLSQFYVRVVPARVEMSKDYKFGTDQLALRTVIRVDSKLPDTNAVRVLVSANT